MRAPSMRLPLLAIHTFALFAIAVPLAAAPKPRAPKAVIEFTPHTSTALSSIEVQISDGLSSNPVRNPVSDAVLFVSKSGGDAQAALAAGDGEGKQTGALFHVRLFIVAGGRLYTGVRGQCGTWQMDVSRCTTGCDGGTFALRRNGAAALELLLGAIPGGDAGIGNGLTISACGFDEESDVRLVAKSGRGLAVAGFGRD